MTCALALPAFAQEKPVAGEVKEGSLKGKTLTFVSYGGIYQDGQVAALQDFVTKSGVTLLNDGPTENRQAEGAGRCRQRHLGCRRYRRPAALRPLRHAVPEARLIQARRLEDPAEPGRRVLRPGDELRRRADVQERDLQGTIRQRTGSISSTRKSFPAAAPSTAAAIRPAA